MRKLVIFLFIFFIINKAALSAQDDYPFATVNQHQRFQALTSELRCLVCQNQNLAESNAPLAMDLREQVYKKIQQGQSDQEIVAYLVARYGHFILYRPPLNIATLGLWLTPFLILIMGIGYLIFYLSRSSNNKRLLSSNKK